MTTHDMLVELLAIKLYEHDSGLWPPRRLTAWLSLDLDDRQTYRNMVTSDPSVIHAVKDD